MTKALKKISSKAPQKLLQNQIPAKIERGYRNETGNSVIPASLQVVGMTHEENYAERKVALRINSNEQEQIVTLSVPDLAVGDRRSLATALALAGNFDLFEPPALRRIAQAILKKVKSKDVIVLCRQGLHEIEADGDIHKVYVWGNSPYWMGPDANRKIVVANITIQRPRSCNLATWKSHVAINLPGNHYSIVVYAHTLAAALRRLFRQPMTSISLVGPSSCGKSITEKSAQSMVGHVDGVKSMSGTRIGLLEYLRARPDSPVFFQDTRQNDSLDNLISLAFDVADGAERMKSGLRQENDLAATMILSNERFTADMVSGKNYSIDEGFHSRFLEIECNGEYGAFHDLHGHESPADFADELDRNSAKYYGAAWPAWIRGLSRNWLKVLRSYETELPKVKAEIAAHAGEAAHGRVNNRILDALSFSAWSGLIACRLGILPLNRQEIIAAFGLVLKEHISRQISGSTPLAEQLIREVRGCLDENSSRFPDLRSFNDEKRPSVYGYRSKSKRNGELFLFLPNVFDRLFVKKFGSVAHKILSDAGFLVTTVGRGNQYQARVPGNEERKSFIAIAARVRFD